MAAFSIVMTIGFSLANNHPASDEFAGRGIGDVTAYMGIIYAGLLVTAAYNTLGLRFCVHWEIRKSPLYFLIISAGINVVLDIVLIRFAGMGVEGCAYATVIAQGVSAICCLVYIKRNIRFFILKRKL